MLSDRVDSPIRGGHPAFETTDIVLSTMLIKRLVDENILIIFVMITLANGILNALLWSDTIPVYNSLVKLLGMKIKAGNLDNHHCTKDSLNQGFLSGSCGFRKRASPSLISIMVGLFDPSNREGHAARIYFNTLFEMIL